MSSAARRARAALLVVVLIAAGACASHASVAKQPPVSNAHHVGAASGTLPSRGCAQHNRPTTARAQTMKLASQRRTYELFVPASRSERAEPFLVALHGFGQQAATFETMSGLGSRATQLGVILALPDATGPSRLWQPAADSSDDQFVDALIAHIEATQCVDRRRVALAGFSAGAAFATAYACRNQGRIASIVTASFEVPGLCRAPEPVLSFHGTADPIVPYGGSSTGFGGPGTQANMQRWARANGCTGVPPRQALSRTVTRTAWTGCAAGADTELVTIAGAGHAWPPLALNVGRTGHATSAADLALRFVIDHRLVVPAELLSFCSAALQLVTLARRIAITGRPNLAGATALTTSEAQLRALATNPDERSAAEHLADTADEAAQGGTPTPASIARTLTARRAVTAMCP